MNKTNIEWVKNPDGTQGYTWNPITGCLNGCEYCYARQLANTRLRHIYLRGLPADDTDDPFAPRLWPERLNISQGQGLFSAPSSVAWQSGKGIFVCSMGDLFGNGVPLQWTEQVLGVINANPQHRFYLLTKQPQNIRHFLPLPDNCWVGITLTHEDQYGEWIHDVMISIKTPIKFISFEPLLGRIRGDIPEWCDWVIIGAQTKPSAPPKIEWVQEITEAADAARTPVFYKNNLEGCLFCNKWDGDYFWLKNAAMRQEVPY